MKKLTILFVSALVMGLSFVSCNKDDDDDAPAIEGKWQISQEGESLTALAPAENEGNCGLTTVDITAGGAFKINGFDYEESVCTPFVESGTWTRKDNSLTVKTDETIVFEILELTESTLKVKSVDEEGTWIQVFTRK